MTFTVPAWVIHSVVLLVAAAITYGIGNYHGYGAGVRDTERRWSDAVRRKEDYDAGQLGMEQPWWKERA